MMAKVIASAILFSMVIVVAMACDQAKIGECTLDLQSGITKLTDKGSEAKKEACKVLEKYANCVRPAAKGCSSEVENGINKMIEQYNKSFDCNIKMAAVPVITSLLSVAVAVVVGMKFL